MWNYVGAFASAPLLAVAPATEGSSAVFGRWTVVCDNVWRCEAQALPPVAAPFGKTVSDMRLRFVRRGDLNAPAWIVLSQDAHTQELREKQSWTITVDGGEVFKGVARVGAGTALTIKIPSRDLLPMIVKGGANLTVREDGKWVGSISLDGAVEALRFIDLQQRRGGGRTALVARGRRSRSARPPLLPVVDQVRPAGQWGLPKRPSQSLLEFRRQRLQETCDEAEEEENLFRPYRLTDKLLLWSVWCAAGGARSLNYRVAFILTDNYGEGPRSAPLDRDAADDLSVNDGEFDPKSGVLTEREISESASVYCGDITSRVWTGMAFVTVRHVTMPNCEFGSSQLEDWPADYRARTHAR